MDTVNCRCVSLHCPAKTPLAGEFTGRSGPDLVSWLAASWSLVWDGFAYTLPPDPPRHAYNRCMTWVPMVQFQYGEWILTR